MKYVFDATPLIYLSKADVISLICAPLDNCLVPTAVFEEVVTAGLERNYPDAERINRAYENGTFQLVDRSNEEFAKRLQKNTQLSPADVAVLAIARDIDGIAVMDEQYGRQVAAVENIETRGTAFLVLHATKAGVLSKDTARSVIDDMIDSGWYIAPSLYAKLINKLESI